jgi:hypothetical protein
MTLRNITIELSLGQTILVGKNKESAKITKIEFHEKSGTVSINTTRGPRSVLTFSLCDDTFDNEVRDINTVADKYR